MTGNFLKSLLMILALFAVSAFTAVDTTQVPPPLSMNGTRGLTQTMSAEALGKGRLSVLLQGNWYNQKDAFIKAPNANANIITGLGALSFGASDYIDVFASLAVYAGLGYDSTPSSGLGSISAGAQFMLPLPAASPFKLGAQVFVISGTSQNQINNNGADGYNYFETRDGYDFGGKVLESLVFGNEFTALKILINEGAVYSLEKDKGILLLLAGGLQGILYRYFVIGLEINSRTSVGEILIMQDPLWFTPSITFRSPYFFNFCFGADISLSNGRTSTAIRALEPYRLFGSLTFSVDVLASQRRATAEKERKAAYDKAEMEQKNKRLEANADSLGKKAHEDSLHQQAEKRRADSLAQVADSLTRKAQQDSALLADTKNRLAEEKAKRSEAEKQLLETGMLILDAVYFESGKAVISINSKPYLKIIGKMLAKYPKLQIEIGGHTDNIGRFESNQRLSQARSESVRYFLTSVAPELSGRLSAMGYGSSMPKEDNTTAEGRKQNRRVELKVLNPEALKEYNR